MVGKAPISSGRGSRQSSQLWQLSGLGFEFASQIIAGLLLGLLIDHLCTTSPLWTVIGTVAGLLVGLTTMIRSALKANRKALKEAEAADIDKNPPHEPSSNNN